MADTESKIVTGETATQPERHQEQEVNGSGPLDATPQVSEPAPEPDKKTLAATMQQGFGPARPYNQPTWKPKTRYSPEYVTRAEREHLDQLAQQKKQREG